MKYLLLSILILTGCHYTNTEVFVKGDVNVVITTENNRTNTMIVPEPIVPEEREEYDNL